MIENLPTVQKFLRFLSQNMVALLLLLLSLSIFANVYLVKWVRDIYSSEAAFKDSTIQYERKTKDKLMDISKEQNKREGLIHDKTNNDD